MINEIQNARSTHNYSPPCPPESIFWLLLKAQPPTPTPAGEVTLKLPGAARLLFVKAREECG